MNNRMREDAEPSTEAVTRYQGDNGVPAEIKDSDRKLSGSFVCSACGATVNYGLSGISHRVAPRYDMRGDAYDGDVFSVVCPVPYCTTVKELHDSALPVWAQMIVKSGFSKRASPYR